MLTQYDLFNKTTLNQLGLLCLPQESLKLSMFLSAYCLLPN